MSYVDQLKIFTNRGPYEYGESIISHRGKRINTTLGSKEYEDYVDSLMKQKHIVWTIAPGYEHRPDVIANKFFGSSELFWIILVYNHIIDPFEGLQLGSKIAIPQL